jgi:DNA-binding MarR family transcriptional regulator
MIAELPKSTLLVIDALKSNGPMAPRDISRTAEIPLRTVTFALKKLLSWNVCRRIPNLNDMRRPLYVVDHDNLRVVFMKYGTKQA